MMDNEKNMLQQELEESRKRIAELEDALAKRAVCNRCGRENKESAVKVKQEVLQAYFRSLLGQTPFSHCFEAFGGRLKVTCTAPQRDSLVARYKNKKAIDNKDLSYLIASTVSKISVVDPVSGYERYIYSATEEQLASAVVDPETRYTDILSVLDAVKLSVVKNACRAFTVLLLTLVEESESEDFYEGAGLL